MAKSSSKSGTTTGGTVRTGGSAVRNTPMVNPSKSALTRPTSPKAPFAPVRPFGGKPSK